MPTYSEFNTSYSGSDISIYLIGTDSKPYLCGDVQTMSVSDHSDRGIVRRLGRRNVSGYTNGPVTVAGTIIFTILNDSPILKYIQHNYPQQKYFKLNQLPPMDFGIKLQSEYDGYTGPSVYKANVLQSYVLGLLFSDSGTVYSIEDTKTEVVSSFTAYDYYPLMPFTGTMGFNTYYEDVSTSAIENSEQVLKMLCENR